MTPAAILRNGFRDQNPGLVQLLGLCPLLAVSTSLGNGLGLGLATLAVLVASNGLVSLVGRTLPAEVRIAVFVLLIAALVTAIELVMSAWLPALHAALGIFLPLIVTNCLVLARAEAFASRQPFGSALLDGFAMGGGFLVVLVALGSAREFLGRGSLGGDLHVLLGGHGTVSGLHLFGEQHGFLLALLPPGAFILLGLGLALRQSRRASVSTSTSRATAVGDATGEVSP
jgi:Na+-translocating ferredoxin:NAD+ oxidoreductase subunit E